MHGQAPHARTAYDDDRRVLQPRFTDVHCHCLPGLDDGPADWDEALALCEALVADGTHVVTATPHQLGRYDRRNDPWTVRQMVESLNTRLRQAGLPLTVLPSADVRLDERIPQLLRTDEVLTVADGGRFLMLELPHEVFVDPQLLVEQLARMDITCVITHPERHGFLAGNASYVNRWAEWRPCLQVTAGSLVGDFGRQAHEAAWTFLQMDLPLAVATDAHDTRVRPPRMRAAYRRLVDRLGRAAADLLCLDNPQRIASGDVLALLSDMARSDV